MIVLIWIAVVLAAVTLYLRQVYSKLSRSEVNHLPVIPFFGHMVGPSTKTDNIINVMLRTYKAFPKDRILGQYEFFTPVLLIRDLELVKRITVKDFEHFVDRRAFIATSDKLFGRNLLLLKGEEWKAMRSNLSPAFTSSKIKLMVPFIAEVGKEMIKALKTKIQNSGYSYIDVEGKDLATRYANDVIASCAFGLKVESQTEDNQFYRMSLEMFNFDFKRSIKVLIFRCFPTIAKILDLTLSTQKLTHFFKEVVLSTMDNREQNNIVRNDMIQLLMQAKKGQLSHDVKDSKDADAGFATVEESAVGKKQHKIEWTDTDLVAQAVLFLLAGFDTVSTAMSFMLCELALNPDVQERLYQEIKQHEERNNGKIDYNSIQSMDYMDMVVSELLRLWPAALFVDRCCVKPFNAGKPNEHATKDYIIQVGEYVTIPIYIPHRDPENFPDPDKFDPERFSDENKHKIKPFTYLPFGLGPRNCIGSRFALCEVKVMLYQMLQHFEVIPGDKTRKTIKLANEGFNVRVEGGAWVRIKVRQ